MGNNTALRFLEYTETNIELQNQLASILWDAQATVMIAQEHGYSFTADELQAAIDQKWGVLSEEELLNVAGGGGNGRSGTGPVDPDTSNPGGGNGSGGTWSPPPGDVSGNSCYFGRGRSR